MRRTLFFIVSILAVIQLKAQIGVGEWRDHVPVNNAIDVTQSASKVYIASTQGIFSYHKSNHSLEKFTKVNKLSDIGISAIEYSNDNEVLAIGYSNGNLDLIFNHEIFNLSDIKREMINGSKSINHILFIDEFAYLSCGFGIVVVNLDKKEIKDTYYIGDLGDIVQVNEMAFHNNYLYAATNQGIYIADYTNQNLIDYSNWQRITEIPSYSSSFNAVYISDDYILVNQNNESFNDVLYSYSVESGMWQLFNSENDVIRSISSGNSEIQIVTDRKILLYNENLNFQDSIADTEIPSLRPSDVLVDENNNYWIAEKGRGLIKYKNTNYEIIYPNAPYSADAYGVEAYGDKVFITGGGITPQWNNMFINGAVYIFQNEQWSSYFNYNVKDYLDVAIDPYNKNHYYLTSWGAGLIEYMNNEIVNTYNEDNSPLQSIISGADYIRISSATFDDFNNLWITNSSVEYPIVVKKADGEWSRFYFDQQISNLLIGDVIVTQNNHKWVILPNGNGLFVFDDNNTIDNENDDFTKKLSILDENGKIITNHVYSIAEDLNGTIWLGTNEGIVLYHNPESVFEDDQFHANRIILTVGEVTQYLLNTEVVTSIDVDGANQKWIGTQSSGVYLVSEDGTEEINHFTEENSPLLSNKIYDVGINHESGEVFFATDKGLISYRGSATMGSDEYRDVYVYPNPVRENYSGEITIRGLVSDVNVKITDISGNIVYETQAKGGQATWSGKDFSGRRPSTGVYLVFCSNDDGTKTYITKLLFIK